MTCAGFDLSETVRKRWESAIWGRDEGERRRRSGAVAAGGIRGSARRQRLHANTGAGPMAEADPARSASRGLRQRFRAALRRRQVEASGVPPPEAVGSMSTDSGVFLVIVGPG